MAIIRYFDPFKELEEVNDRITNLMREPWGATNRQSALTAPVADVYTEGKDDDERLIVEAHLPGYREEDVNVDVHEGALEIRAEHQEADESDKKARRYMLRESTSSYYRRIGLPKNVDADNITAHFDEGILRVTVPFKELPKPKKVRIESQKKGKKGKK